MGETSFSLVYGAEALILVEVGEPTLRYFRANEEANNEAMLVNLELLDERMGLGVFKDGSPKAANREILQSNGQPPLFQSRRLGFKESNSKLPGAQCEKIGLTWEGPYRVLAVTGEGLYELENQDGEKLPSNWNVAHLKRYYC
ncbi:uncharacterized protein [Nicotiana tomentosiformis]|uniref:uncharacterized protein n=1 Tax=Nicotiana tomentosiformis TaxID=4098 RepID=UPI00388CE6AE